MGHYFEGKTHYEYSQKILAPRVQHVQRLMDQYQNDPVDVARHLYEDVYKKSGSVASDDLQSSFSGGVHALFRLLIEKALEGDYTSYSRAAHTGRVTTIVGPLMEYMGSGPTMNEVLMAYHILSHQHLNGPTYEVTGSLAKQLCDTELRGVYTDEIRLPFPAIYLDLPPTDGFEVNNPDTGIHRICGIYVTEDRGGETPILRVYVVGEPKGTAGGLPDDATLYYNLDLDPGTLAEDSFRKAEARAKTAGVLQDVYGGAQWHSIYSWVLNVVLYLTWGEPGEDWMANKEARDLWNRIQRLPKGSKKRKKLNDRFHKLDPQRRIVLGRGIKYDRPEGHKIGQKIATTFRVSGHWKRQHYGKGKQEVKRIFIEPYWKGTGDTVLTPRQYTVK